MGIREDVHQMKMLSPTVAASSIELRNRALEAVAAALREHAAEIFDANARDLEEAKDVAPAVLKRLTFREDKLEDVLAGIRQLIDLPDPTGVHLLDRQLDRGLELHRITVPIGVIGVIFEARPDALVQISALCVKSGNCAILKGGRETAKSNRILFEIINQAVTGAGLPAGMLRQAEVHTEIDELLTCERDVDLLIPRGSNAFVRYIMDHTKIPVMGHADGICHIYVDRDADQSRAIPILLDAKTQYTAACNAVETILLDRAIAADFLPRFALAMKEAGVVLRGDQEAQDCLKNALREQGETSRAKENQFAIEIRDLTETGYATEYLTLCASVKLVDGVKEACAHINCFGSHHTDCILTENDLTADYFLQMVDSAGVYRNCSTRFADGFRYGFGAEVGISTSKLHARGPVGLEGLVTYKYQMIGHGQIVGDYASGKSHFHFEDL